MDNPPAISDFELIRRVGGGSYGDVWLARSVTGIYRAIKIVDRSRFPDERPFLREFDGIMRFQKAVGSQPRQLALLHVGKDDRAGVLYYVMELADDALAGTDIDPATYVPLTLKELRLRRGILPPAECVQIGVELATALLGLHTAGLIHRDVKPSNVIFVNGLAKLADVGLIASSEQTLTSIGTPGYVPPEGAGTASADIYGLGKILYELSTGFSPSEFPRIAPETFSSKDATPFLELNEIILRACDPDPGERYESSQQIVDELLLLRAGRSVKELNRMRKRVRVLVRVGVFVSAMGLIVVGILAFKNYFAMKRIAAQEVALRDQARANERFARYTSDLHLAQLALSHQDFGGARVALRHDIPLSGTQDPRGLEWFALWNEAKGGDAEIFGQLGGPSISAIAVSSDGSLLATQDGGTAGNAIIWDLTKHTSRVVAKDAYRLGRFSSDETRLMVGTAGRQVYEINVSTGEHLPFEPVSGILVESLPDGNTALIYDNIDPGNMSLILWDVVAHRETAKWHYQGKGGRVSLSNATASADGHWLAVSVFWAEGIVRKREVIVVNTLSGAVQFRSDKLPPVQALRFSPDGLYLAVGTRGPVVLLDTMTGKETHSLNGHFGTVNAVEFSVNGRLLVTGASDQTARVWNLETGRQMFVFRGHEAHVRALAWRPEKDQIISAGGDGTSRLWAIDFDNQRLRTYRFWSEDFGDFIYSPSGDAIVATNSEEGLSFVDTASMQQKFTVKGAFRPLTFSRDEKTFLALSTDLRLVRCDVTSGTAEPAALHITETDKLLGIQTSASGAFAAFIFQRKGVEIWDLLHQRVLGVLNPPVRTISSLAWSYQDTKVAIGDRLGKVVINFIDGSVVKELLSTQASAVTCLAFSPDGKWLAIGREDGHVIIWNLDASRIEADSMSHGAQIDSLTFSPDSRRLLSAAQDGNIIIWKVDPFIQVAVWPSGTDSVDDKERFVGSVRFNLTGSRLGIMKKNGVFRQWSLQRD